MPSLGWSLLCCVFHSYLGANVRGIFKDSRKLLGRAPQSAQRKCVDDELKHVHASRQDKIMKASTYERVEFPWDVVRHPDQLF